MYCRDVCPDLLQIMSMLILLTSGTDERLPMPANAVPHAVAGAVR
jgi:hypothetical protein